jgi:hypothetical protein
MEIMTMATESSDISGSDPSEQPPVVEQDSLAPPTVVPVDFEADLRGDTPIQKLIPSRNPCSLLGYYLGVFSLIPLVGILLALPALILGVIGLVIARKAPDRRGKVHAIVAIILGILGSYNYVWLYLITSGLRQPNMPAQPGMFPYWG